MRRSGKIAAFILATLVVLGPAVLSLITPVSYNLTQLTVAPLVLYWTVGSVLLIAPILALTTLPGDWFERWWAAASSWVMSIDQRRFAITLVAGTLALTVGFSWYCFANRPTTADEFAQLFHARILLSGRLALPPDPNPEFFAIDNIIDRGSWLSQFPIGGPAILAIGVAIHAPWLINSIFTALTALNVYRFAQIAYPEGQARAAALLYAASPMVLIMGGSQMNHTPTTFFVTLALVSLARWLRSDTPALSGANGSILSRDAAIIGLSLGAAVAIRPLDGALASAVMGTAMLWSVMRDRSRMASMFAGIAAGAVPVALLLAANARLTGNPFLFGYEVLWGPDHSWGLHNDPLGLPHDAARAALLALKYSTLLNWTLTAWPVPVLLIVAFGLSLSRKTNAWDLALVGAFFTWLIAYAMYWHEGQFAGPRFLFTVAPAVVILASRAPFMMADVARGNAWRAAIAIVPACVFMSWVRPMPPFGVRGITTDYRESRTALKRLAPGDSIIARLPRSLVFVQEGAAARLTRRLWGIGISRQDAARLMRGSDACSLLDAVRREESRGVADTVGRLARIEESTTMLHPDADRVLIPGTDPFFRVNDQSAVSNWCVAETTRDRSVGAPASYGPLLLENRFDALGRLDGQVIYAMNLGERNEVLRARFGDRLWFRYEVPADRPESAPVLVPYDSPSPGIESPATKKAP